MAKKKQAKPAQVPKSAEPHADAAHPGSERFADEQREGGPRYHGGSWEQAAEDEQKGRVARPESADTRSELERNDESIEDPGTRGAVFGRGGKGIVERDETDDPSGAVAARHAERHGGRPGS